MAFAKKKSESALSLRPKAAMVPKKTHLALVASVKDAKKKSKAREVGERRIGALIGVAAAYGVGYLEANGKMPALPGGFEPTVVIGALLGFVAPEFIKGKAGAMCAEAGAAVAGVAAYKLAMGAPLRVAGEDEDE